MIFGRHSSGTTRFSDRLKSSPSTPELSISVSSLDDLKRIPSTPETSYTPQSATVKTPKTPKWFQRSFPSPQVTNDHQKGDDYGIKLLADGWTDGKPPVGTLVFIHGLSGHFTKTWSHDRDTQFFWPKIWLPTADGLTNVRVMSFGYDAAILRLVPSIACLKDFARTFLMSLLVSPHLNTDLSPIILVSHSMGGLLAKEAFNMASSKGSEHKALASRIAGMVFFATPHRGASNASFVKNILRMTPWSPEPTLSDLEPDSALIEDINERFRNNSEHLELVSFYETHPTSIRGLFSKIIVSKESAIMGLPGEHRAAIAADHCGICWFRSQYEANYLLVSRTLCFMMKRVMSRYKATTQKLISIPFPRNQDFVGHKAALDLAEAEFEKGKIIGYAPIVAFHGIPGVGKTQLLIEFAYRHTDKWSIFWVRADSHEILVQEFQKIAENLKIVTSPHNAVSAVRQWLQKEAGADWVMIFDNADDISILADFLPLGTTGGTIISSRDPRLGDSIASKAISVGVLSRNESIQLLQRRAHLTETDDIETLVDLLGELPLALEQAAAYMRERHISVAQFIKLFRSCPKSRVLSRKVTATRYTNSESVFATISIALEELKANNRLAVELLMLASFFDGQDLTLDLLTGCLNSEASLSSGSEALDLLDALEGLESSALVIRKPRKSSIWIHVLVQAIVLEQLESSGQYNNYLDRALSHLSLKFAEAKDSGTWQDLQPHVLKLLSLYEGQTLAQPYTGAIYDMFYTSLLHLRFMGEHEVTLAHARVLAKLLVKDAGSHDLRTIRYLRLVGVSYFALANSLEAEKALKQVVDDVDDWVSSDDQTILEVSRTERVLAIVYARDGQPAKKLVQAKVMAQKALDLDLSLENPNPLEIALAREALGHACRELGQRDEAVEQMELAVRGYKLSVGTNTITHVKGLHNLGAHRRLAGQLDAAEEDLQKALVMVDQVFGFLHFTKPKILSSLAAVQYDRGNLAAAAAGFEKVLTLQRTIFDDPLHPQSAKTLLNLGIVYRALADYDRALAKLQGSITAREAKFGVGHKRTDEAVKVMALVYQDMERNQEAEPLIAKLKERHGADFLDREVVLCPNLSLNWSAEEHMLYSTNSDYS